MRFADFLRATVIASGGAATLLATLTVVGLGRDADDVAVFVSLGWWASALILGVYLGRRAEASPPIARLLAGARTQASLPDVNPAGILLNRLWVLLASTFAAGIAALVAPQVGAVAAGFAMIWALAWRRQHAAVLAIEERDGVRFYVDRTSPVAPIRLIRTPGFGGTYLPH